MIEPYNFKQDTRKYLPRLPYDCSYSTNDPHPTLYDSVSHEITLHAARPHPRLYTLLSARSVPHTPNTTEHNLFVYPTVYSNMLHVGLNSKH